MADSDYPPQVEVQQANMYPPIASPGSYGGASTPVVSSQSYGSPQAIGVMQQYPSQPSPAVVMNPLGAMGTSIHAVGISIAPSVIQRSLSGREMMYAAHRYLKPMRCCYGCATVGRHELLVAKGQIVADKKGACCNYSREVLAAQDISSWSMQTATTCGGNWFCCKGKGQIQVRAGPMASTVHLKLNYKDLQPSGPVHDSIRMIVNADKRSPIITNDMGRQYQTAACVCCCFTIMDKLLLGGKGANDVTGTRVMDGCFHQSTDVSSTQVPDVSFTQAITSMGACGCIDSNAGCCHCGEQLEVGTHDMHIMRLLMNKGTAKDAVTELYKRNRHPMMPEPALVRKIPGTTVCCGTDAELTVTTESVGLTSFRWPTSCSICSMCQTVSSTTISLDDVRVVRVEEQSPCTEANRTMSKVPRVLQNIVSALSMLDIFSVLVHILSAMSSIPIAMFQVVLGVLCLPCRRSLVVVDGPADLAFRIRAGKDTESEGIDFAAELQQELRSLKDARNAMLAGALSGSGKDQVLFTAVEVLKTA